MQKEDTHRQARHIYPVTCLSPPISSIHCEATETATHESFAHALPHVQDQAHDLIAHLLTHPNVSNGAEK